jgi:hypothetical protein
MRVSTLHSKLLGLGTSYPNVFLLTNITSLYLYLFWDALNNQSPALSGAVTDSLFVKQDRFMDWINTLHSAGLTRSYGMENQVAMPVYGPLTYAILKPLAKLIDMVPSWTALPTLAWLGITTLVLLSFLHHIKVIRAIVQRESIKISPVLIASITLMSYPFLFAFDRGNLELITFALVGWYLALIGRQSQPGARQARSFLSFVKSDIILALAICIKPYTLLFGLCMLTQTKGSSSAELRQASGGLMRSLLLAILISVISLALLYQGDLVTGYRELQFWQQQFRAHYVISTAGDVFFPSPFIAFKTILSNFLTPEWLMGRFFNLYPLAAFAYCTACFVEIFRSPIRHRWMDGGLVILLTMISAALLIFPFNANEYKAIYCLLPFLIAYRDSTGPNPDAGAVQTRSQATLVNPHSLAVGFCFFLLVNRYGFIGDKLFASVFTSLLIALFPLMLSKSLAKATDDASQACRLQVGPARVSWPGQGRSQRARLKR